MKKTVSIDDDVVESTNKLSREEMPSLSGLITDALRDYLDDPEGFKRRRKARLKRAAQAAEEPVPAASGSAR